MPNFPPADVVTPVMPEIHGAEYHTQLVTKGTPENLDGWTVVTTGTSSVSVNVGSIRLQTEDDDGRRAHAYFGDYTGVARRVWTANFDKEPKGIFLIQLSAISMDNRKDYWVVGNVLSKFAGFKYEDEVLYAVVDDGSESTEVITGITVTDVNKYEVRCIAGAFEFYVNGTLEVTMTTGLPTGELTGEVTSIMHLWCETGENATKQMFFRGAWFSQDWS